MFIFILWSKCTKKNDFVKKKVNFYTEGCFGIRDKYRMGSFLGMATWEKIICEEIVNERSFWNKYKWKNSICRMILWNKIEYLNLEEQESLLGVAPWCGAGLFTSIFFTLREKKDFRFNP